MRTAKSEILLVRIVCACFWVAAGTGRAQTTLSQNQSVPSTYSIVSRAPYSRSWQRAILQTNDIGSVRTNFESYTEVRSGLCYLANGVFVDSTDEIDLVADGAQAVHGQHHVHWAANANTPSGAVQLTTPGGDVLQSTVWGISYWDTSINSNILLGNIQDSQGVLTGNQVLYENAFGGNLIKGDIAYTYTVEGLEQNIVFREQLPNPSTYGLNPDHTYLQVLTEFFNPPAPAIPSALIDEGGVTNDIFLNFGDMSIGVGQAFLATNEGGVTTAGSVEKQWTTLENRQFLIEQIPFSEISSLQGVLPEHVSIARPSKRITRMAALKQQRPLIKPKDFGSVRVAMTHSEKPGLVIDYNLVNTATNLTFQGNTTYYVSGGVTISGTNVFEGGAVIKFTNNASITESPGPLTPQVNFLTAPFRPVVFTSKDDNSVGQTISGSTGNPTTNWCANPALSFISYSPAITNIRVSYAKEALSANPGNPVIRDAQFVNCSNGVSVQGGTLTIENGLFANVTYPFSGIGSSGIVIAKNITASGSAYLVTFASTNAGQALSFTNSVFSQVTNLTGYPASSPSNYSFTLSGDFNGFYASSSFGSDTSVSSAYPFQTAGAGGFYLPSGSQFIGAGTENVDSALLSDLAQETVSPPLIINGWVTNSLTLFPQAQRDGGNPSLGYHYYPIDWAISIALSNVTMVVLPGTAIAAEGASYGLTPYTGSTVSFQGTATAPIHFFHYNAVQEQSNTNWESLSWTAAFVSPSAATTPSSATFQFTDWNSLASDWHIFTFSAAYMGQFAFQNCQFYDGTFRPSDPAIGVTNCLFSCVTTEIQDTSSSSPYYFYNNLFTGGAFTALQLNSGVWTLNDNLFDTTNISYPFGNLSPTQDVCDYNGYLSTNTLTGPKNAGDVILTNSPAYQASFLGSYYYPTSQTNLIHDGSRLASAAGLYHYTVTTNNVIESNGVVSIGFHFVATDANGNPLDSNGDGIPDYIEDANGNGVVDAGEVGWNLTNDLGLTVIITQPANNSVIP